MYYTLSVSRVVTLDNAKLIHKRKLYTQPEMREEGKMLFGDKIVYT